MSPYTPQYAHLLLQPQLYQTQASTPAQSVSPISDTQKKIQVYVSNLSPAIKDGELTQLFQVKLYQWRLRFYVFRDITDFQRQE